MGVDEVRTAYGARAAEYTALLGDVEVLAAEDRRVIAEWASTVEGPVLDVGCGPGHWTAFLAEQGLEVEGVDLVPEFVETAAARFPALTFRIGDVTSLPAADASLGGILSWYSLIHTEPETLPQILLELARCLRPGGTLLLGFVNGARVAPFDHAVVTGYAWPIHAMEGELVRAGFEVLWTDARTDPDQRPHGVILARR